MKLPNTMPRKPALRAAMLTGLTLLVAACGGLGEGVGPVSATLQPFGGLPNAPSTRAFTCLNTGLSLFIGFSDGSTGDFSLRATYSSSNPAVARVSNGEIAVPGQAGSVYGRGTILPTAVGTATITVQYLTFTRTIDVVVSDPQNLRVVPATANLAARSLLDLAVFADLDGLETSIDSQVTWAFVNPNADVATISSASGTITGVAAGNPLTARASLPGCTLSADASVTVANLQSLALTREFGDNANLILGTSERIIATGTLDNGATQDLSNQVAYTSSNPAALTFFGIAFPNLVLAASAVGAPVQVGASFANPAITAQTIDITPVTDSLNSLSVAPTSVSVRAGASTAFRATGNYASGATQDITRHVAWSSSNTSFASIQSSGSGALNSAAGTAATSTLASGQTVTITATATNAASQPVTATAALNIQ